MKIKPIKSEADYQGALNTVRQLWEAKPDTPQGDTLDILTTLIEAYEEKHYAIAPPDPIEAIKFRMEQEGLSKTDVAPYFGGRNRVSEIFNHKRRLTATMMRKLHRELKIPAESLLAPLAH